MTGTPVQDCPLGARACPRGLSGLTDGQLLEQFTRNRDPAAVEELVTRHGPMVLGVCRRVLEDAHLADDAFQATFLLLVRKAATLTQPELVGHWLYGVAYRIARKARAREVRWAASPRQQVEVMAPPAEPDAELAWQDLRRVLDEEVQRLPEKYRLPVVLCYLEGRTNEEAGRKLGWPIGTVAGRLFRARDLLRERLTRRGVTLSGAVLGLCLTTDRLSAAVPVGLHRQTVESAVRAANLSPFGVMAGELFRRSRWFVLLLLLAGTTLAGVGWATSPARTSGVPGAPNSADTTAVEPGSGGCHAEATTAGHCCGQTSP